MKKNLLMRLHFYHFGENSRSFENLKFYVNIENSQSKNTEENLVCEEIEERENVDMEISNNI